MRITRRALVAVGLSLSLTVATLAWSSDHDDGKTSVARPEADIADVFSWTSADTQRANLVMTVYPSAPADARFATDVQYVFHTARHQQYGVAPFDRANIICTFDNAPKQNVNCWLGDEWVGGDASTVAGIQSKSGKLRVFAGRRDDPAFFDRVKFLQFRSPSFTHVDSTFTAPDIAGCKPVTQNPFSGAGTDTFAGKNVLAIVLSVDKTLLTDPGNPVLSVWASTRKS